MRGWGWEEKTLADRARGAAEWSSPRRVEVARRDEARERRRAREASSIVSGRARRGYERERGARRGGGERRGRRIDRWIEEESERTGMTR